MGFQEKIYNNSPISLQTLLLNVKAAELYYERYGKKFWDLYNEFDKYQWQSEAELEELQNHSLRELINHAYTTVPYYQKKMEQLKLIPGDIQTIHDLYKYARLSKFRLCL